MVDITSEKYERNGIKAIVDNYRMLRLNEQHTEERLDLKNLREISIKYHSDHWKHRY